MTKVLILIGNFNSNSGGAQRAIANQLHASDTVEFKFYVAYMFGCGTMKEQIPESVTAYGLNAKGYFDLAAVLRLIKYIRMNDIKILHTQSNISGIWGRLVKFYLRTIKVISTEQNSHQRYLNLVGLLNGLTLPLADRIVCVSSSVTASFFWWEKLLLKEEKISVIYNAVDTSHYSQIPRDRNPDLRRSFNIPSDAIVVGNIARHDPQKNQLHLISEFSNIIKRVPSSILIIVGSGKLKAVMEKRAEELSASDNIMIIGARTDMDSVYRMLDIFVLPSIHEGFSLALLEAMSSGIPIVCSNIPQLKEAAEDCAEYTDPVKQGELSAALLKVILNEDLQTSMSRKGQKRCEEYFSSNKLAHSYSALYQ